MKYHFLLLHGGKVEELVATDSLDQASAVLNAIDVAANPPVELGGKLLPAPKPCKARAGRKGRPVVVLATEPDALFEVGDVFESAVALSRAIGYPYNAVSVALQTKPTATIRGLTVAYKT